MRTTRAVAPVLDAFRGFIRGSWGTLWYIMAQGGAPKPFGVAGVRGTTRYALLQEPSLYIRHRASRHEVERPQVTCLIPRTSILNREEVFKGPRHQILKFPGAPGVPFGAPRMFKRASRGPPRGTKH